MGGAGGGGRATNPGASVAGTENLGGGGGGGGSPPAQLGSNGGSGVAILRYPTAYSYATVPSSVVVSNTGGYQIYKFTTAGNITFR